MIKSRKKVSVVILLAFLFIVLAFGFSGLDKRPTASAETLVLQEELQEKYTMNESISIPKAKLGDVEAEMVVVFPSGVATSKYDITLTEAGKYSVEYSLRNGTELLEKTVIFYAESPLYSFSEEGMSAEYTSYNGKSGLKASFVEKGTLIFNQPINLSGATESDVFFEFFSSPKETDKVEHKKIYVQLIDVKDPDNYVTILNQSPDDDWAQASVAGNGQKLTGRKQSDGKLFVESEWGTYAEYRYYGTYANGRPLGSETLRYSYNEKEKQFFVNGTQIADLDSPIDYSTLWHGFTSNQVIVKVWCDSFFLSTADVMLLKVGDINLTGSLFVDKNAPTIKVDVDENNVPFAKVDEQYKVFDAVAVDDLDLISEVKVKVYYNYNGKKIDVSVEDGYFLTSKATQYYVEYSSTDRAGNVATKTIEVTAKATGVKDPIIAIVGDRVVEAVVGEKVAIADYATSGGSGKLVVETSVLSEKETVKINENTFIPLQEGTYTVVYTVTDYLGHSSTAYYDVEVVFSNEPMFVTEANLPKYFFAGSNYNFEEYYAIDYKNNAEKVLATLSVEDKNGLKNLSYSDSYVPDVVNNLDTVTLRYRAGNTEKVYTIPCIVASSFNETFGINEIDVKKYFVGDVDVTPTIDDMVISATSKNASWMFANKQVAKDFMIEISGAKDSVAFGGIRLRFEDSINAEYAIELELLKGATTTAKLGTQVGEMDFSWAEEDILAISLKDSYVALGSTKLVYSTYTNGEKFNGFPSNYLYVSCEFINATEGAQYAVKSINEQRVSSYSRDELAPKIVVLDNKIGGAYLPGSTINISNIVGWDVLSGNTVCTVSVYDSSYEYITALDGTLLNEADASVSYQIVLNEIGRYYIRYTAIDENGRPAEYPLSVRILDTEAPVMKIDKAATSAKVGESFTVAKVTVTDNYDALEKLDVYCIVTAPDGKKESVKLGGSYVPTVAGNYTITYIAVDTTGNMTTASYVVNVK